MSLFVLKIIYVSVCLIPLSSLLSAGLCPCCGLKAVMPSSSVRRLLGSYRGWSDCIQEYVNEDCYLRNLRGMLWAPLRMEQQCCQTCGFLHGIESILYFCVMNSSLTANYPVSVLVLILLASSFNGFNLNVNKLVNSNSYLGCFLPQVLFLVNQKKNTRSLWAFLHPRHLQHCF